MKKTIISSALVIIWLAGLTATAWSDTTGTPGKTAQDQVGIEAIVVKVENDRVTIVSAADKTKGCTVFMTNARGLKKGDIVQVQGDLVRKAWRPFEGSTTTTTTPGTSD